ncbi:MAG: hypothetical protein U0232_08405 [Thermomicrobiales bacterium]
MEGRVRRVSSAAGAGGELGQRGAQGPRPGGGEEGGVLADGRRP